MTAPRTPEWPLESEFARNNIMARVSGVESGSPTPDGVRAHQIDLQFANLLARDADIAQLAHASRDGVGNPVFGHQRIHHGARAVHRLPSLGTKQDGTVLHRHFAHRFESQIAAVNVESVQESFRFLVSGFSFKVFGRLPPQSKALPPEAWEAATLEGHDFSRATNRRPNPASAAAVRFFILRKPLFRANKFAKTSYFLRPRETLSEIPAAGARFHLRVDHHVRGLPFGQHFAIVGPHQFVSKVNHGFADILQMRAHDNLIVIPRRRFVAAACVHYRDKAAVVLAPCRGR